MEDKRITKSKIALKRALLTILGQKPFDSITVTEICEEAGISRITFYAHYDDKFFLADEIFDDMFEDARANFKDLERKNNPANDTMQSYCNLLEAILNLYVNYYSYTSHVSRNRNPYLYTSMYHHVYKEVDAIISQNKSGFTPMFPIKRLSACICNGIWAYFNECIHEDVPMDQIKRETKEVIKGIFSSPYLFKKQS